MHVKMIVKMATLTAMGLALASGAAAMLAAAPDNHDDHAAAKRTAPKVAGASEAKPAANTPASVKPAAGPAEQSAGKAHGASDNDASISPAKAMQLLREGNARWVAGEPTNPNISAERRADVGKGQHPFVTVLTCADSRLPVERIFDRGVGDVFVIRVAGNIAGGSEVGTIEYGVEHLKTPVIVVMGHTKCGAVAAASSGAAAKLHGPLQELVRTIEPGVERARRNNPAAEGDELTSLAIRENVWQSVYDMLKLSEGLRTAVRDGDVRVVGAVCDIITGKVEFLGQHPWQAELLDALEVRKPTMGAAEAAKGEH